jgi:DNA-binding HxlR family transcriptional regulator
MSKKGGHEWSFPDPPTDWAAGLAKRLEQGNPLDREIALSLIARPHRYAELLPLLRGKGDNNLTQALKRLRHEGVIHMRTSFHSTPPYDYYELTVLGIDVVMGLAERQAIERLAQIARTSAARDSVPG